MAEVGKCYQCCTAGDIIGFVTGTYQVGDTPDCKSRSSLNLVSPLQRSLWRFQPGMSWSKNRKWQLVQESHQALYQLPRRAVHAELLSVSSRSLSIAWKANTILKWSWESSRPWSSSPDDLDDASSSRNIPAKDDSQSFYLKTTLLGSRTNQMLKAGRECDSVPTLEVKFLLVGR